MIPYLAPLISLACCETQPTAPVPVGHICGDVPSSPSVPSSWRDLLSKVRVENAAGLPSIHQTALAPSRAQVLATRLRGCLPKPTTTPRQTSPRLLV
ncbi:hypothetical protein FJTKL_09331 [Diaporthe vaccinii]|uniref:Secreted protein n=1 Tax=Diaporthe vaccinii TaxID=105482 RepID=A0ABR4FCS2_9PEZI